MKIVNLYMTYIRFEIDMKSGIYRMLNFLYFIGGLLKKN